MAKRNQLTHLKKRQADQLAKENRLEEALVLYESVCRTDKMDVEAWMKLSAIQRRLGNIREAEACGRQVVTLQPTLALAHYTLAIALEYQGKMEEALACYDKALKLDPGFALVHYLRGNILHHTGRLDEALIGYRKVIALKPDFFEAMINLAAVLTKLDQLDEANETLRQALKLRPNAAEVLINLANVAERKGQAAEALLFLQRAVCSRPDSVEIIARLAAFLEKIGQVEEAKAQVRRGLSIAKTPALALVAARVARAEGQLREALTILEEVDPESLDHRMAGEFLILQGQIFDGLKDAEKAFPLFMEGNRRLALATQYGEGDASRYLERIRSASQFLSDRLVKVMSNQPYMDDQSPVFLVGFPRSGTTLLEQILDCHPALQTLEEMPAAAAMEQVLQGWLGDRQEALAELDSAQISELRNAYFTEVARHLERRPGTMLVDKLPLNLIRIPLIWRVFPNARFILALRHPCDVCLSCFMQSFTANEAMSSFSTLGSTIKTYEAVMGLWQEFIRVLPLRYHAIRYEDLVTDFEKETRALLDFLGVGWNEAVLNHTEHAKQSGIINTPSYHQVTQPIYQHAKYRWKRYAREFEPMMPILQPFIDRFGYDD